MAYVDEGGVLFFHRFDEAGQMLEGMVVVLQVPLWACMAPGCLYGRPVEEAEGRISELAEDRRKDAVRRFYG